MTRSRNGKKSLAYEAVTLDIDAIKPYWRNPRRITAEAVNAVASSIETYGYLQPIVVDQDNIIIIGHTRYAALRKLKVEQVQVRRAPATLSAAKVKELRVLDNRTAEYSEWDFEKLAEELEKHATTDHMKAFFPEAMNADDLILVPGDVSEDNTPITDAEMICPACFHGWEIDTEALREQLANATDTTETAHADAS